MTLWGGRKDTEAVGRNERIAELARARVSETGRLTPAACRGLYQELAAELGCSWVEVYFRIPGSLLPTREEVEAWEDRSPRPACPGCGRDECPDCQYSQEVLGGYSREQLLAAQTHASAIGGLALTDIQRELFRRRARGLL